MRGKKILKVLRSVFFTVVILFFVVTGTLYCVNYVQDGYKITFKRDEVNYENVKKVNDIINILGSSYYEKVDKNKLLEGAAAGIAAALNDPYTVYFTKDEMKNFNEQTEGNYVGVGFTVTMDTDGILKVVDEYDDSPAKKAGILPGDKIIRVDDKDVTTINDTDAIISMIKGEENTNVKITVYRPSERKNLDFNITRKRIEIKNIESEIVENNIGYIRIITFDEDISNDFNNCLNALMEKGIKSLIIDVRDNPGGSYDQVVKIADTLLPEGLIVYMEDRYGNREEEYSDANQLDMPIAVLINENSASASEILAGALKDHNKAVLVGVKTYGKGLVQSLYEFPDGSGLKYTVAKYYTPSDVCIQGIGIEPNYEVKPLEKYQGLPASEIPREDDVQLQKAIDLVKQN